MMAQDATGAATSEKPTSGPGDANPSASAEMASSADTVGHAASSPANHGLTQAIDRELPHDAR